MEFQKRIFKLTKNSSNYEKIDFNFTLRGFFSHCKCSNI